MKQTAARYDTRYATTHLRRRRVCRGRRPYRDLAYDQVRQGSYEAKMILGKRLTIALAVFALVVMPLAIYTAGYFWLGQVSELPPVFSSQPPLTKRVYPRQWIATIYGPAGRLEAKCRGIRVEIGDYEFRERPSS